jgi:hypothetical protein
MMVLAGLISCHTALFITEPQCGKERKVHNAKLFILNQLQLIMMVACHKPCQMTKLHGTSPTKLENRPAPSLRGLAWQGLIILAWHRTNPCSCVCGLHRFKARDERCNAVSAGEQCRSSSVLRPVRFASDRLEMRSRLRHVSDLPADDSRTAEEQSKRSAAEG